MTAPRLGNLVPYLFCADIEAMIDWYTRVFGFVEKSRWRGDDGKVHNAEMCIGDTELWMDGANAGDHLAGQGEPYFSSWCVCSSIATTPFGSGAWRLIVRPSGSLTKASTTAQCCGSNGWRSKPIDFQNAAVAP